MNVFQTTLLVLWLTRLLLKMNTSPAAALR